MIFLDSLGWNLAYADSYAKILREKNIFRWLKSSSKEHVKGRCTCMMDERWIDDAYERVLVPAGCVARACAGCVVDLDHMVRTETVYRWIRVQSMRIMRLFNSIGGAFSVVWYLSLPLRFSQTWKHVAVANVCIGCITFVRGALICYIRWCKSTMHRCF